MTRSFRILIALAAAISLSMAAIAAGLANKGSAFKPVSPFLGAATTQTKAISDAAFTYMATNALQEHQRSFFFGNRLFKIGRAHV